MTATCTVVGNCVGAGRKDLLPATIAAALSVALAASVPVAALLYARHAFFRVLEPRADQESERPEDP